jgi:hypothetical protein
MKKYHVDYERERPTLSGLKFGGGGFLHFISIPMLEKKSAPEVVPLPLMEDPSNNQSSRFNDVSTGSVDNFEGIAGELEVEPRFSIFCISVALT